MPRTCTICSHPDVESLNKDICNNISYRNIALRASTSATSVMRHIEKCLKLEMSAVVQAHKAGQAFDFATELQRLYQKATKMVYALEKWLIDPDNPDEFDIGPRDAEILVTYLDHNDTNEKGKPARKKGMLSDLLERAEAPNNITVMGVASMAVDNRKLYLDAFKTLNDRLEQIAKFYGHWTKEKANPADADTAINAIASAWVEMGFYDEATARQKAIEWVQNKPQMVSQANN